MRRDGGVRADLDQPLQRRHPGRADLVEPLQRHRRRLDVDALADAHARRQAGQRVDVAGRAAQHRLQHDPEVLVAAARAARGRRPGCRSSWRSPPCRSRPSCHFAAACSAMAPIRSRHASRSMFSPRPVGFTLTSPSSRLPRDARRAPRCRRRGSPRASPSASISSPSTSIVDALAGSVQAPRRLDGVGQRLAGDVRRREPPHQRPRHQRHAARQQVVDRRHQPSPVVDRQAAAAPLAPRARDRGARRCAPRRAARAGRRRR